MTEKRVEELVALLREAREALVRAENRMVAPPHQVPDAIRRIDAALAEGCPDCGHRYGQQEYCQGDGHAERLDSATPVVEWRPADQRVFLNGASLRVVYQTDGLWMWSVYWPLSHRTEHGLVATEAEAKSAAIEAKNG